MSSLSLNVNSDTQIDLSWVSSGGSTSGYRLAYQVGAVAPVNCSLGITLSEAVLIGASHSLTGLIPDTQYSFRLCTINANPTPDVSLGFTSSATTLESPPPNILSLVPVVSSGTQVDLTWVSGGGSTSDYRISYQVGAVAPASCALGTTISEALITGVTHSITGLTPSTQYSFRVCAINSNPTPDVSSGLTSLVATDLTAPPNPVAPVDNVISNTQIDLSWTSGGGSTSDYRISYQVGAVAPVTCALGTTISESLIDGTSHSVTGLSGNTQYSFRICAINANASPLVSVGVVQTNTTLEDPPPEPTTQVASTISTSQIDLSWASGGGSTSDYRISYQEGIVAPTDCSSGTTIGEGSIVGTSHSVTGLSSGTLYSFRICSINSNPTPDESSGVTVSASTEVLGLLDISFDGDGVVETNASLGISEARRVAIQADGKIVVVGMGVAAGDDFLILRYNADGSLDTSFSADGIVQVDIGHKSQESYSLALQADGKIIVVGESDKKMGVLRLNTDGSLDTSFSGDGLLEIDVDGGDDRATGVAIQADGKIIVGGSTDSRKDVAIVRLNSDGSLDTSFDTDGMLVADSGDDEEIHSLALQADEKIILVGANRSTKEAIIFRFNTDGSLDTTFSGDGFDSFELTSGKKDVSRAVKVQGDGKIVVAGDTNDDKQSYIMRYLSTGVLDTSFDTDGFVISDLIVGGDENIYDIQITSHGKYIIGGIGKNANKDYLLAKYTSTGTLDTSFDTNGYASYDLSGSNDICYGLGLQSDGKVLMVGESNKKVGILRVD